MADVHLIREMMETPDIIRNFNTEAVRSVYEKISKTTALMLTGEGSSRIFPAKNLVFRRLQHNKGPAVLTESAFDLSGLDLSAYVLFGASNSGRTKELIGLFKELSMSGHRNLFGLTCTEDSLLEEICRQVVVLRTGKELAVAATKSVVAQALFYDFLLGHWTGATPEKDVLAGEFENALSTPLDPSIIEDICRAEHVYFCGMHNGVAEELALKVNETIRKKSAYFPGTYLLHGVEEVVGKDDVIVLVDDMPGHLEKIRDVYLRSVGCRVIAISAGETIFPTLTVGSSSSLHNPYIRLAAGWNLLSTAGLALKINMDLPVRARKIGNEFTGTDNPYKRVS